MRSKSRPARTGFPLAVLAAGLAAMALYRETLDYGWIWDDPIWLELWRTAGWRDILTGSPDYPFYRPGTAALTKFLAALGGHDARLLHAAQIGWHALATMLVACLIRAWGAGSRVAIGAAVLFATAPAAHQTVSWGLGHQPAPTTLSLAAAVGLLVWSRARPHMSRLVGGLGLAAVVLVYGAAVTLLEAVVPLALVFPLLVYTTGRESRAGSLVTGLVFCLVAAGFGAAWLAADKKPVYAALALDPASAAFIAQGLAYPIMGPLAFMGPAPEATASEADIDPGLVGGLAVLATAVAFWAAGLRNRRPWPALAWAILPVLPVALALDSDYVLLGPRLIYPALPGVAWIWAAAALSSGQVVARRLAAWPGLAVEPQRASGIAYGGLVALMAAGSIAAVAHLHAIAGAGTAHLGDAVRTMLTATGSQLFVNFPDRIAALPAPQPLGWWGLTLAPADVPLVRFAANRAPARGSVETLAVPPVGADERRAFPHQVDLLGLPVGPVEVASVAARGAEVYLSRYGPGSRLALAWVGQGHRPGTDDSTAVADFGAVVLVGAELTPRPGSGSGVYFLDLTWSLRSPPGADLTVYVHVFDDAERQVGGADGDPLSGLAPFWAWPPESTMVDRRSIDLPVAPGVYSVTVGVYHRDSGERPGALPPGDGPHGEVLVGRVRVR